MFYTFFTYNGQFPESKNNVIHIDRNVGNLQTKEQVMDKIIHIVMTRITSTLDLAIDEKVCCSIQRDGDVITADLGKNSMRTFQVVEELNMMNTDNVKLTSAQRNKKMDMYSDIAVFFKKNKMLTLNNIAVAFLDMPSEQEPVTHKILKVEPQEDGFVYVLSYNPINAKYYVSRLSDWSYDMIYELYVKVKSLISK